MLLYDANSSNHIIDYDITFDCESKKLVLELLRDCFNRREIRLLGEETFLLHKHFDLENLKRSLDKSKGWWHDLLVYYYTFGNSIPKKSEIGNLYLGEEIKVTSTTIKCPMASIIAFILHHLNDEECMLFINSLTPIERTYIEALLDLSGAERLSCLLDTPENIDAFLKKCLSFKESMSLEELKFFEKIWYFKSAFSYSTLTPSQSYNQAYLNSIVPIDEMEWEEIQDIEDAAKENTEIVKMLKLEPKRIIH